VETAFIGIMKTKIPVIRGGKVLHRLYEDPNSRKTKWKSPS
jgi:hypothetical protein